MLYDDIVLIDDAERFEAYDTRVLLNNIFVFFYTQEKIKLHKPQYTLRYYKLSQFVEENCIVEGLKNNFLNTLSKIEPVLINNIKYYNTESLFNTHNVLDVNYVSSTDWSNLQEYILEYFQKNVALSPHFIKMLGNNDLYISIKVYYCQQYTKRYPKKNSLNCISKNKYNTYTTTTKYPIPYVVKCIRVSFDKNGFCKIINVI